MISNSSSKQEIVRELLNVVARKGHEDDLRDRDIFLRDDFLNECLQELINGTCFFDSEEDWDNRKVVGNVIADCLNLNPLSYDLLDTKNPYTPRILEKEELLHLLSEINQ